jgi:hypothetical protein
VQWQKNVPNLLVAYKFWFMLYNIPYYKVGKDRDFGLKILSSIFDFKSGLSDE